MGLEVIPERAGLIYVNPKYAKDADINVRRYSRNSPYVLNIRVTIVTTWANNVSLKLIFYEYLHNEYKRSFVEMNYKLCDLINKDQLIGPAVRKIKLVCPVLPGPLNLHNLSLISVPAVDRLPYKWPFEKAKIAALFITVPEKELIVDSYIIASFKQSEKSKKKS